jgi:hypothetical protein
MGLLNVLRNFADISGGKWLKSHRHSTWIDIGDLYLGSNYVDVSYSKESLLKAGHDGTLVILRSQDFSKLRNFYFGSIINHNTSELRIMRLRTENMMDKFIDEKIFDTKDCFDINFSKLPKLLTHLEEIERSAKLHGYLYDFNGNSWFDELTKLGK